MDLLPVEIKLQILLQLSIKDILSICQTNKEWKQIYQNEYLWSALLVRDYCKYDDSNNKQETYVYYYKLENLKLNSVLVIQKAWKNYRDPDKQIIRMQNTLYCAFNNIELANPLEQLIITVAKIMYIIITIYIITKKIRIITKKISIYFRSWSMLQNL